MGRDRCESDFERAMYDRLNVGGFRVLTQVSAGGFRIDLVVEGAAGKRLEVECDGDQYHGPDMWIEDLQRQRTLERTGWTFWRCWGSSFLRDKDACMADLFAVLKDHKIEPIGALDADLSDVVEYREVGQIDAEEDVSGDDNPPPSKPAHREHAQTDSQMAVEQTSRIPIRSTMRQGELLSDETVLPLWAADGRAKERVEIGDSIRYVFADDPDEVSFVTLVNQASNPDIGTINRDTVIGRASFNMTLDEEKDVPLPMGRRRLRVIEVLKPTVRIR